MSWVENWQQQLVELSQSGQPDLDQDEPNWTALKLWVFQLFTVMLCIYLAEQRQLVPPQSLRQLCERADTYQELALLWQKLAYRTAEKFTVVQFPAQYGLTAHLTDQVLQDMIDSLYIASTTATNDEMNSVEILAQTYERILAGFDLLTQATNVRRISTRKIGGIYYTPKSIVQFIVQTGVDAALAATSSPSILDPACGGGLFLLAAYQYLLDQRLKQYLTQGCQPGQIEHQQSEWRLSLTERQQILQLLHGVDIDPQAVQITQLSLWLKLLEHPTVQRERMALPDLSQTIRHGNALVALNADSNHQAASIEQIPAAFNWKTCFPDIFAAGGFDLVIGNPPYINAESMSAHLPDWRSYCTAHYQTARGSWDLFCIFIEKALQLSRIGGFSSLVVPNKLLSAEYAGATRMMLTETSHIIHLRDYSIVSVFAASIYPIVYLTEKTFSTSTASTLYQQMQTIDQVQSSYRVHLHNSLYPTQPWLLGIHCQTGLMQRLEQYPKLGELTQVTGAATVAEAYIIQNLIQNQPSSEASDLRVVNSGTIDRYCLLWGRKPLRYLGQTYRYPVITSSRLGQLPAKRLEQAQQPKIIVAGMTQRLECALDLVGWVLAGKSTVVIRSLVHSNPTALDLRYLLGLLNSRLLSCYFLSRFSGNRLQGNYLRVGPPQLRQLPIAVPCLTQPDQAALYQQMITLVEQRSEITDASQGLNLDAEIDAAVYQLYQLSEAEVASLTELFK